MLTGGWDVLRLVVLLACAPLLGLTAARAVVSPSKAQLAVTVSTALLIAAVASELVTRLGTNAPATLITWLVVASVPPGLWGGWAYVCAPENRRWRRNRHGQHLT